MKTVPLTARRCPEWLHEALRKSAESNRRSLNNETLTWLEKQAARERTERPVSARETARILREANKGLSAGDRKRWADGITEVRKMMADEHLH
jgi:Arc-like DNA binding domain